jgi:branched-chain amino acid transport system substrate-binding protein
MISRRTLLAGAAALTAAPRAQAQDAAHALGTLFPMSGPVAELGSVFANGVQLALDHIAADKILKRPVELRAQDSQASPQGGAVGMTRLASVDRAPYVLLGVTGVAKAAAPIGTRNKVVMVNGGGVGPDLAGLSPFFFNVIPLANQEVPTTLSWLQRENLKRVALIYIDDPLGHAVLKELETGLPKIGGTLTSSHAVPPTAQQFAAIAARIREAKPDAVYFASYGTQMTQIIKQLRDNGVPQQLLTYSIGTLPSIAALPESEGLVFTTQAADWASDEPAMKRFVTGWRAKYNSEPSNYALNYYNGTMLFAQLVRGLEQAGKTVDGENLRAELLRLRRFALAGGEGSFSDEGTMTAPIQVNRITSGRSVKVT